MFHPDWCDPEFCTAYADDLDRPYHRSRPTQITTEDGDAAVYVHAGADADNSGRYVEIAELDLPLTGPFWKCEPRFGRETLLSMKAADALQKALAIQVDTAKDG
jgi:hypothetical protein